jgi:protein-L-isoaspartate(D-aspartate) O-methyltransferase
MISLKAAAIKVLKTYLFIPMINVAIAGGQMAAWRPFGSSNTDLVHNLKLSGIVKSADVAKAMGAVDRANYAPYEPYYDSPQPIGFGQTISAPHMHAYALEHLSPNLRVSATARTHTV